VTLFGLDPLALLLAFPLALAFTGSDDGATDDGVDDFIALTQVTWEVGIGWQVLGEQDHK